MESSTTTLGGAVRIASASGMPSRLRALVAAGEPSAPTRYAAATIAIALTATIQLSLFSGSAPWFLYTPAIVLITLALGTGAGVWATLLGALGAGYAASRTDLPYFLMPVHWAASVIFLATTLGLVALVRALKIALRDADALRAARDRDLVETAEREAFLASVLSASTDCIKVLELDGTLSFMSEGGMAVMEIGDFNDVRGCPWPDFMKDGGVGLAAGAIEAAKEGRATHFEADADTYLGTPRHWSVSVSPIRSADGAVARILSVSRDHTALAEARERQELLNGELAHRLKNTLSVIQAIAHQTLGRSGDSETVAAFGERLSALSKAHEVLTAQSWSGAELREVVVGAVSTFDESGRIIVSGPDIEVGPRAALALSLLLHELATNAVKYGALSVSTGRVNLGWVIGGDGDDGNRCVRMTWAERGGPPAVEPTRRGFGSRIIRMGLTGSGGSETHYGTEGLTVALSATVDQLLQS